jgi:peroxiredoxin
LYSKAIVLLVCLALFASCGRKASLEAGDRAPEFSLRDMDGKAVSLSDYRGRVVVVEFWASWCEPCRVAIPEMNSIYEKYKDRAVLLAISVDRDISDVASVIEEEKILYPVLFDDRDVNRAYRVSAVPSTFLINKSGRIAEVHKGYSPETAHEISKAVEGLL